MDKLKSKDIVQLQRKTINHNCGDIGIETLQCSEAKLYKLAKDIAKAAKIIAKDDIDKDYYFGSIPGSSITVRSDSGYEAIYIGNINNNKTNSYMCLYSKNTPKTNSFPSTKEIAKLLKGVIEKRKLEVGEGKAYYFDYEEFGGIEKQLNYFSEVISSMVENY